jgi:hypothetical protein
LQKVIISFYHFPDRAQKWWAFKQMRLAHIQLKKVPGLEFYKLLGSGAGKGFSVKPDWGVYVLLSVWNSAEHAEGRDKLPWWKSLALHTDGQYHFELAPYHTKGTWNGREPFELTDEQETDMMAVITRASIKWTHLIPFWASVPMVSRIIAKQKSLRFQKGIGEWPLIEQATFSLWDREAAMRDFAYKQKEHREVVQKTRRLNWYREEQFTRFNLLSHYGSWPNDSFKALKQEKINESNKRDH